MIRRAGVITCMVAFGLGLASPARGQDAIDRVIGRPLAAVEVRVEGRPETNPALLALVDISAGDRLSLESMRRVSERFNQVPRFEGVRVLAEERPEGLALVFDLEPRHPIDRLEFTGEIGLPVGRLDQLVREHFNGLPPADRLAEVEDVVRRILVNEGYRSASVLVDVVQYHNPDRATVVVRIDAGGRTLIASSDVSGRSPLSTTRILSRLGAERGQPYRERDLAAALAALRDDLRRQGYYTAIAQYQRELSEESRGVALRFMVEAGPLVSLRVNGPLPGSIDSLIPIERLGSVDPDLLDDSRGFIEREWRREGYWKALVSYTLDRPAEDRLIVSFDIQRGRRYRIERVDVPPDSQLPLSIWRTPEALQPNRWFSEPAVETALLSIKAEYQRRGYHRVVMEPEYREVEGGSAQEGRVVIVPAVTEGPRAIVAGIRFDLGESPAVGETDLRARMQAREGGPFVPAHLVLDRQAVSAYYEQLGYLNYTLDLRADLNAALTEAQLTVIAREGQRVIVGEIIVVGNNRLSREAVLREITLAPGQPYSESARTESRRQLYALGVFRNVQITAEPRLPGETTTRIVVSVEETSAVTLGWGGGLEVGSRTAEDGEDRVEVSPRAFIDIGRRNLWGRNRAVNLFSRGSLRPQTAPGDPEQDGRGLGFAEYRVSATYRDENAFGTDSRLLFGVASEQVIRTNFNFARRSATIELSNTPTSVTSVFGRYALEWTRLFDERVPPEEQPLIDRLFPQVRLSVLSGGWVWDRRNDGISPSRGGQVSGSVDVALRQLGSEVGFARTFLQGTYFYPLAGPRRVVFASRVQVGLARGFERAVEVVDDDGDPVIGPGGEPLVEVVADLPASQRYFAGGTASMRGFQLDRLGVPEILNASGLSNGGNGLLIANLELRASAGTLFGRRLGLVGFLDAGNVFNRVSDLDLGRLRTTVGAGLRYDSPLGPLRFDVGVKTNRLTFANGRRERGWEFHLSIGEVF